MQPLNLSLSTDGRAQAVTTIVSSSSAPLVSLAFSLVRKNKHISKNTSLSRAMSRVRREDKPISKLFAYQREI